MGWHGRGTSHGYDLVRPVAWVGVCIGAISRRGDTSRGKASLSCGLSHGRVCRGPSLWVGRLLTRFVSMVRIGASRRHVSVGAGQSRREGSACRFGRSRTGHGPSLRCAEQWHGPSRWRGGGRYGSSLGLGRHVARVGASRCWEGRIVVTVGFGMSRGCELVRQGTRFVARAGLGMILASRNEVNRPGMSRGRGPVRPVARARSGVSLLLALGWFFFFHWLGREALPLLHFSEFHDRKFSFSLTA